MKTYKALLLLLGLGVLAGCASESRLFDNNCSGNGFITNVNYCKNDLHPNAGPWAADH
jgi:hypothetical protein